MPVQGVGVVRLTKRMRREIVTFAYEKADGSLRKAKGTLQDVQNLIKGTGPENYKDRPLLRR